MAHCKASALNQKMNTRGWLVVSKMRSSDFVATERRKPVLNAAIVAIHILQAPLDATQKDLATQRQRI